MHLKKKFTFSTILLLLFVITSCEYMRYSSGSRQTPISVADLVIRVNSVQELQDYFEQGLTISSYPLSDQRIGLQYALFFKPDLVPILINEGINPIFKDDNGKPFLSLAAMRRETPKEVFSLMIEKGADINVNYSEENGESLFSVLIMTGHDYDTINLFIESGVEIDSRDKSGITPFLCALASKYYSDFSIASLLLENGANPFARSSDGRNALMFALRSNKDLDIIKALIKLGVSVNDSTSNGNTPIFSAAMNTSSPEIISLLYESGASWEHPKLYGISPWLYAMMFNPNLEVILELMKHEPPLNYLSYHDWNMLMAASSNPNLEVMSYFLKQGHNVNYTNSSGMTVLMRTAEYCTNPEMISLLLSAGADPKQKDFEGKTALDYARDNEALVDTQPFWQLNDATYN